MLWRLIITRASINAAMVTVGGLSSSALMANPANQYCLQYDGQGQVIAQLDVLSDTAKLKRVRNTFNAYVLAAQKNDKAQIISLFSTADGSAAEVQRQINSFDKYELFHKTKVEPVASPVLRWGDYVFVFNRFEYEGQSLIQGEPLHCVDERCRMSLAHEMSSEARNMMGHFGSALVRNLRTWENTKVDCPKKRKADIEIFSEPAQSQQHPLRFFLKLPEQEKTINWAEELAQLADKHPLRQCVSIVNALNSGEFDEQDRYLERQAQLQDLCIKPGGLNKLVPIVSLTQPVAKRQVVNDMALAGMLANAQQLQPLLKFELAGWTVPMLLIVSAGEQYLLALPLVEKNSRRLFDWSFFNSPVGHFMASSYFAELLKKRLTWELVDES